MTVDRLLIAGIGCVITIRMRTRSVRYSLLIAGI